MTERPLARVGSLRRAKKNTPPATAARLGSEPILWSNEEEWKKEKAKWRDDVVFDTDLRGLPLQAALLVCMYTSFERGAYPSIERMVIELDCADSALRKALNIVVSKGWLIRWRPGRTKTNRYALARDPHVVQEIAARRQRAAARSTATKALKFCPPSHSTNVMERTGTASSAAVTIATTAALGTASAVALRTATAEAAISLTDTEILNPEKSKKEAFALSQNWSGRKVLDEVERFEAALKVIQRECEGYWLPRVPCGTVERDGSWTDVGNWLWLDTCPDLTEAAIQVRFALQMAKVSVAWVPPSELASLVEEAAMSLTLTPLSRGDADDLIGAIETYAQDLEDAGP